MASADYLCCSKCGCKIIYTPEDIHPSVYCQDCLEAEFAKVDRYWKALREIEHRAKDAQGAFAGTICKIVAIVREALDA